MFVYPDDQNLQYTGRIDFSDPKAPRFLYAASMVTLRFRGTGARAVLRGESLYWDSFAGVLLDGKQSKVKVDTVNLQEDGRRPGDEKTERDIAQTQKSYVLAENLPDAVHTLTLFKRQDSSNRITLLGFELPEGSEVLEPPQRPARRMEVYGDSVSAGEVAEAVDHVGKPDPEHEGEYSNAYYSYAWTTARKLRAQLHDTAQGGIALLDGTGYFGNDKWLAGMESVWDKLQYNPNYGPVTEWDFGRYTPHVVVVAIGQNDSHPEDYMKEDCGGGKAARWKERYRQWIGQIREKYPRALIVLATTILNHDPAWDDAIGEVCAGLQDPKIVHFLYRRNGCGTPGHIRIPEAEEMAEELASFIEGFGEDIWQS